MLTYTQGSVFNNKCIYKGTNTSSNYRQGNLKYCKYNHLAVC